MAHKLGWKTPLTTKKFFDIATGHMSGEDIVRATTDCRKWRTRHDRGSDEDVDDCLGAKRRRGRRQQANASATTVSRMGGRPLAEETPDHIENSLKTHVRTTSDQSNKPIRTASYSKNFYAKRRHPGGGLNPRITKGHMEHDHLPCRDWLLSGPHGVWPVSTYHRPYQRYGIINQDTRG